MLAAVDVIRIVVAWRIVVVDGMTVRIVVVPLQRWRVTVASYVSATKTQMAYRSTSIDSLRLLFIVLTILFLVKSGKCIWTPVIGPASPFLSIQEHLGL